MFFFNVEAPLHVRQHYRKKEALTAYDLSLGVSVLCTGSVGIHILDKDLQPFQVGGMGGCAGGWAWALGTRLVGGREQQ